ncbi:MAG: hypothetical protein ABR587_15975 [Candidatus Binatia bacterium]
MRVFGTIVEDETGKPLEGLRVRALDKDFLFDDRLGDAVTDAQGRFDIDYSEAYSRDFNETEPDIYIRVFDPCGEKLLYSTERAVRWNSLVNEKFDVRISKALLG